MTRQVKRGALLFMFAITLVGCLTLADVRSTNRTRMNLLSLGMTKREVLATMGTDSVLTYAGGLSIETINNPYRSEAHTSGKKSIEILYYYTDMKSADGAITDDELTPFVFEDGTLVGWGWSFMSDVAAKYEIRIR